MKNGKRISLFLALALAVSLMVVPVYAAESTEEAAGTTAGESVEQEAELSAGAAENAPKKTSPVINIALSAGVVAVIVIAAAEIRRDNRKKETHG